MSVPRVRFCPAPSGWLHVGGARTALYNWLHARGEGGTFVVRIEDTDVERASEQSARGMLEALTFLGLHADEGPEVGGPYGPYRQSERAGLYAAVARRLLEEGYAYEAFETPEELDADRRRAQQEGRPPGYSGAHRHLGDADRRAFREQGREPVIRLVTPDEGTSVVTDLVRGSVEVAWKDVPDFVVSRADGSATYYLANTVDDLAQGITLVARGEDLLSATPRQRLLADVLLRDVDGTTMLDDALAEAGLPARPDDWGHVEAYAHLPMLVGADRKKLSKRHGAVSVEEFRRQGILPEVLVNLLALCGWSPGDGTTEQMAVDELIERFDLRRVGRGAAYFDVDKLRAFNGDAIKRVSHAELAARLVPHFAAEGVIDDPPTASEQELLAHLVPLLQERIQTLSEAVPLVAWCFAEEVSHDEKAVAKHLHRPTAAGVLDAAEEALADLEDWSAPGILAVLDAIGERMGLGRGKVMQPVRVAVSGTAVSPPLPETLAALDRELVVSRIRAARPLAAEAQA